MSTNEPFIGRPVLIQFENGAPYFGTISEAHYETDGLHITVDGLRTPTEGKGS
jgi:hypothetical protein